jgi:hypothetical protein
MKQRACWIASLLLLAGCGNFGKVDQGRVVEYDRARGLATLIRDSNDKEPGKPKYDVLPPIIVRIPANPHEMGPVPEPGRLMRLDRESRQAILFDPAGQTFKSVPYREIERHENVFRDDARVARSRFPVVNREKKTITVYLRSQRELVTFSVADEYLALPDSTLKTGDEVRYYYKDPAQALRLMNLTKSDLT